MKEGDIVRVKNPTNLWPEDNEEKARSLYPWKFEVGIVTCTKPYGGFPGKEVYVHFPSYPEKTILADALIVVHEGG